MPSVPTLGSGPVGKLFTAALAGVVVLVLGSQVTKQYVNLTVGNPGAVPSAAPPSGGISLGPFHFGGGASAPPPRTLEGTLPGMVA